MVFHNELMLFSYVLHMISIMLIYISNKKVTEISYSNFSNTSVSDLNILKPNYRHHHSSSCARKGNLSKGRELFSDCAKIEGVPNHNLTIPCHLVLLQKVQLHLNIFLWLQGVNIGIKKYIKEFISQIISLNNFGQFILLPGNANVLVAIIRSNSFIVKMSSKRV